MNNDADQKPAIYNQESCGALSTKPTDTELVFDESKYEDRTFVEWYRDRDFPEVKSGNDDVVAVIKNPKHLNRIITSHNVLIHQLAELRAENAELKQEYWGQEKGLERAEIELDKLRAENAELKNLPGDIEHYQLITSILEFDKINIQKRLTAATAQLEKMAEALVKINSRNPAQLKALIVRGDMRGTCGLLQDVAQEAIAQYEKYKKESV